MKREEKEVKLRMILTDYHRRDDYELRRAVNDILALDALHPAEGAEIDDMMFTISEDGINPLNEQPTAEGAEEWLKERGWDDIENDMIPASIVVKQLQEFATLHAQKLADKMESERLREELIKYDKHYWGHHGDSKKEVDGYLEYRNNLKSREQ